MIFYQHHAATEVYIDMAHYIYSDHLRKMLNDMMTSSEFADVTLVTDD